MTKEKEENSKKASKTAKSSAKSKSFFSDERIKFVFGILITGFALYLLLACVSYLVWWKADLSLPWKDVISGPEIKVKNWAGKSGFWLADMIIGFGFGYGAFFLPLIIGSIGLALLNFPKIKLWSFIVKCAFAAIILSLILGFIFGEAGGYLRSGPGGAQGYLITRWLNAFMGMIGTGILLVFVLVSYLIFALKFRPESFGVILPGSLITKKAEVIPDGSSVPIVETDGFNISDPDEEPMMGSNQKMKSVDFVVRNTKLEHDSYEFEDQPSSKTKGSIIRDFDNDNSIIPHDDEVPINITRPETTDTLSEEEVEKIMGDYDPRLDLSRYKFPPVSILKEHKSDTSFDNNEVFENKENIIKTLGDHKIRY